MTRLGIPKLSEDDGAAPLFGHTSEDNAVSFADLLEDRLPAADFTGVLTEKGDAVDPRPLTAREMVRRAPPPQESLDLHGCTAAEAEVKLTNFLNRARYHRLKTVLIITGRGLHSPNGPVLPEVVESRLAVLREEGAILAFRWEGKNREQSGALIVHLP